MSSDLQKEDYWALVQTRAFVFLSKKSLDRLCLQSDNIMTKNSFEYKDLDKIWGPQTGDPGLGTKKLPDI